eukprot:34671-Rhodomonas_salina.3
MVVQCFCRLVKILTSIFWGASSRRKRDQAYGQLSNSADLEASLRFQEQEAKMAKKGEALKKLLRMALSEPKPASADKFPKQERRSKRCSVSSVSSLEDSKEPGKGDEDQYLSRGVSRSTLWQCICADEKLACDSAHSMRLANLGCDASVLNPIQPNIRAGEHSLLRYDL